MTAHRKEVTENCAEKDKKKRNVAIFQTPDYKRRKTGYSQRNENQSSLCYFRS